GIMLLTDAATNYAPYFQYYGGQLQFGINGIASVNTYSWTPTAHTWYHVAVSRSGSTCRMFIDGTQVDSDSNSTAFISDGLLIGAWSSRDWNGYMDEVRISRTARYTANFTPSTTAFKDDKDTQLLMHMDGGGGIDPTTNLPTLPGQGTYFWDASNNAIFYDAAGLPTNKSLISFDGSGDYLSVPSSSDFALETSDFTVEMWLHPKDMTTNARTIYDVRTPSNTNGPYMYFDTSENLFVNNGAGGEISTDLDIGRWYHIAYVRDSNTIRLYKDGTQVGSATVTAGRFSDTSNRPITIGRSGRYQNYYYNGYVDEVRISNNCRYTNGTAFTPSTTPFTADSNTKLLIQSNFSEGGLGADHSGNYNDFSVTNLVATDQMVDSPTNNFCTLNPLMSSASGYLSEGNLRNAPGSSAWSRGVSTFGATSGKWYAEVYVGAMSSNGGIGIRNDVALWDQTGSPEGYAVWQPETGGYLYLDGLTDIGSVGSFAAGDIVSIAVDMDNNTVQWRKNNAVLSGGGNTAITMPVSTRNGFVYYGAAYADEHIWNFGQDSSFAGEETAQGNQDGNGIGDFYYPVPSGFNCLCSDNLSDPSIADPTAHFNTVLYTG
ncbi:MAG: hypothetical protein QF704_09200, partial [Anaerolineales bacterium]|nr:hypothetical protein [Anaerolineales bacterium]